MLETNLPDGFADPKQNRRLPAGPKFAFVPADRLTGSAMLRFLYDAAFSGVLLLTAPVWLSRLRRRGEWRRGFGERLGRYAEPLFPGFTGPVAWVQAVSVGEVVLATQLVQHLAPRMPGWRFVISTTTNTGRRELEARMPAGARGIYYPFDRRAWVRRAFEAVQPRAIILVEAELWPNFVWEAQRRQVPLLLANARMTARSARRYRRFGFLFRGLFAGFAAVSCPTAEDVAALVSVGYRPGVVRAVGHPKFDAPPPPAGMATVARGILESLGVPRDARVVVGGSTHAGEERLLGEICRRLRTDFPDLFLVVVPRHCERAPDAARDLREAGVNVVLRTALREPGRPVSARPDCLVVDTTGELRSFYAVSDVVFIGKSLLAEGGQNPIEPAALGRAIITGPHMQNFRYIHDAFRRSGGVREVPDAAGLELALRELLAQPVAREELGVRARRVVESNRGALERTVEFLTGVLRASEEP